MESPSVRALWKHAGASVARMLLGLSCLGFVSAQAMEIRVRGTDGVDVTAYRYTIEEDATFEVVPDQTGLSGDPTLALAFHRSHTRVVQVGHSGAGGVVSFSPADSSKRYYVSVMPDNASFGTTATGYTMNGFPIRADASGVYPNVVVPVNPLPFKTPQISVFVFEDNAPINGTADAPGVQEAPLCGWEVQLFEAGGTYGASGGRVATDTFGNPLGTEYYDPPQYNPDGSLKYSKLGANQLWTDRNGVVRIKNLSPAKYTIFSIAPPKMPSVQRCNFADANGNPTGVPIWIATEAQRTRTDQVVWDNGFEIAPAIHGQDQSKWHHHRRHLGRGRLGEVRRAGLLQGIRPARAPCLAWVRAPLQGHLGKRPERCGVGDRQGGQHAHVAPARHPLLFRRADGGLLGRPQ